MWVNIFCKECGKFIERELVEGPDMRYGPDGYIVCDECYDALTEHEQEEDERNGSAI